MAIREQPDAGPGSATQTFSPSDTGSPGTRLFNSEALASCSHTHPTQQFQRCDNTLQWAQAIIDVEDSLTEQPVQDSSGTARAGSQLAAHRADARVQRAGLWRRALRLGRWDRGALGAVAGAAASAAEVSSSQLLRQLLSPFLCVVHWVVVRHMLLDLRLGFCHLERLEKQARACIDRLWTVQGAAVPRRAATSAPPPPVPKQKARFLYAL